MKLLLIALAAVACAAPAAAQAPVVSGGLSVGSVRARSRWGSIDEVTSGAVIGGEGRVRLGRVTLDGVYVQGALNPDTGTTESRDYAEGGLFLTVATVPGVGLRVGPHARAYISPQGTQRWLFWTARLRGEGSLIAPAVTGFAELWAAWAAVVNVSEAFGRATGGVVGMTVRIPGSPVWGRLSYGIERAEMGNGARLETVEGVSLAIGVGRR